MFEPHWSAAIPIIPFNYTTYIMIYIFHKIFEFQNLLSAALNFRNENENLKTQNVFFLKNE